MAGWSMLKSMYVEVYRVLRSFYFLSCNCYTCLFFKPICKRHRVINFHWANTFLTVLTKRLVWIYSNQFCSVNKRNRFKITYFKDVSKFSKWIFFLWGILYCKNNNSVRYKISLKVFSYGEINFINMWYLF